MLAQKVTNPVSLREPNASARRPTRPSLGKEASALFYWLVLRTAPYKLTMSVLQMCKPIGHVIYYEWVSATHTNRRIPDLYIFKGSKIVSFGKKTRLLLLFVKQSPACFFRQPDYFWLHTLVHTHKKYRLSPAKSGYPVWKAI